MFENILVGVDGTTGGRDAIAFAQRLAGPDARITLVYVRGGANVLRSAGGRGAGLAEDESRALLARERDTAEMGAELASVEASSPGAGLHAEAERRAADLIVVGSSARGLIGRAMLGDDTRGALNGAPCAVAIACRGYDEHPFPVARIGVAYNGSPESERALAAAGRIASETRAEVIALEVVGVPPTAYVGLAAAAYGAAVDRMVGEAKERMAALEGASGRVAYGVPGEELAAFSAEVDLLVVGSRSYGPLRRLVLGSTSDYLERHARSSLLVLPRRRHDED
ncbi:MAG TPA: universal stress protein [Solirubrobacteraceae bacterium]|nr:universal stress protein [Solirubrobacteraceae bacterium]